MLVFNGTKLVTLEPNPNVRGAECDGYCRVGICFIETDTVEICGNLLRDIVGKMLGVCIACRDPGVMRVLRPGVRYATLEEVSRGEKGYISISPVEVRAIQNLIYDGTDPSIVERSKEVLRSVPGLRKDIVL